MRYPLDLETLLIVLSSQKQNCKLSADLKRFPGIAHKGPCHAYITLNEGKIISCVIQDDQKRILVDADTALDGLKKMGQLDWACSITNQPTTNQPITSQLITNQHSTLPVPAKRNTLRVLSLIPRRVIPIEMIDKNAFPRKYWQVLLLVDGSRTVAQIADILRLSSPAGIQELINILNALQQQGILIAIDPGT